TEVVTAPYEISHDQRTRRSHEPDNDELRRFEPALDAQLVADLGRAEVLFTLDAPYDLGRLAPNLRWIQALGSGVGQFASSGLDGTGIVLTNGAGVGSVPIAEWVMARVLSIVKRLDDHAEAQRRHQWEPRYGSMLSGRTMVIVGLGAIGREVSRRARAFGVHVIGLRRSWVPGSSSPDADELMGPDALHQAVGRADIIVVAAPGSHENEGLFDAAAFAATRPGAIFVNVARGSLVEEPALIAALESGQLQAAAIDVARHEPLPPEDPLWDAPNLSISPHSSTSLEGYMERTFDQFLANLDRYVEDRPLENVVDMSSYSVRPTQAGG
ncbi:MAG TPA: D-2-hydroxyacid dehydrogenase, partial [Acidimicrobiales bacterium]|nr:D-2-hydroxyacid dehydrogenase [Acidimicrobiales bacterium]